MSSSNDPNMTVIETPVAQGPRGLAGPPGPRGPSGDQPDISPDEGNMVEQRANGIYVPDTLASKVDSVAGKQGDVLLDKDDIGLGAVDNTSDADKPVSTAVADALAGKVDAEAGKQLSDENYTLAEKNKLGDIADDATKNRADSENADKVHTHAISDVEGLDDALLTKLDKTDVVQESGQSTTAIMSQKAVTDLLADGGGGSGDSGGTGASSLQASVKVTVGAGGDFPTINAAILHLSRFTPDLGVTAEVELMSGFVMEEQLIVEGLNLGWVTITGVDAETVINEPSLTRILMEDWEEIPAFGVVNGTLPIIGQLFSFSSKGSGDEYKSGVIADNLGRASILEGCGVKNAGSCGILASGGSTINAMGAIASEAGETGIFANSGSTVNAAGAIASGAGDSGFAASAGSTINAQDAIASGAGTTGFYANGGSTIKADGADASGAGGSCFSASDGSTISAAGANASGSGWCGFYTSANATISADWSDASGAEDYGFYANSNSKISASGADASGALVHGICVENGSIISANEATGSLSQTENTVTANGIIFQ